SGVTTSRVGLGTWAIGGWMWGGTDEARSIATIRAAVEQGITLIDTAPVYGFGRSEEIVGRALAGGLRDRVTIATKVGIAWRDGKPYRDGRRQRVVREIEDSLRRLRTDVIDLYQVHWPDPEEEIEAAIGTLARLREQGKLRWIGVSNFSVDQMKRAMKIAPITSLQPPYSMLRRAVEAEILPFAKENGIGVINYSPMLSGMLTGKMTAERVAALPANDWRRKNIEFSEPRLSRNLQLVEELREIGNGHGVSPGVVAVAWTLHHPAITAAIVGGRSGKQVEEMVAALTFRLSEDEYERIGKFLESM
ncbi:MAG: aldo/keto reductase, partial [Terracidiphilus sp.]